MEIIVNHAKSSMSLFDADDFAFSHNNLPDITTGVNLRDLQQALSNVLWCFVPFSSSSLKGPVATLSIQHFQYMRDRPLYRILSATEREEIRVDFYQWVIAQSKETYSLNSFISWLATLLLGVRAHYQTHRFGVNSVQLPPSLAFLKANAEELLAAHGESAMPRVRESIGAFRRRFASVRFTSRFLASVDLDDPLMPSVSVSVSMDPTETIVEGAEGEEEEREEEGEAELQTQQTHEPEAQPSVEGAEDTEREVEAETDERVAVSAAKEELLRPDHACSSLDAAEQE